MVVRLSVLVSFVVFWRATAQKRRDGGRYVRLPLSVEMLPL